MLIWVNRCKTCSVVSKLFHLLLFEKYDKANTSPCTCSEANSSLWQNSSLDLTCIIGLPCSHFYRSRTPLKTTAQETRGAFLWENPNVDFWILKQILCFFTKIQNGFWIQSIHTWGGFFRSNLNWIFRIHDLCLSFRNGSQKKLLASGLLMRTKKSYHYIPTMSDQGKCYFLSNGRASLQKTTCHHFKTAARCGNCILVLSRSITKSIFRILICLDTKNLYDLRSGIQSWIFPKKRTLDLIKLFHIL